MEAVLVRMEAGLYVREDILFDRPAPNQDPSESMDAKDCVPNPSSGETAPDRCFEDGREKVLGTSWDILVEW